MSHFRPLWSGLGGWPPANWSSPPSLTIPPSFPHLIHFSLSLSLSLLFPLSPLAFLGLKTRVKASERARGEVDVVEGAPVLLHQAHQAAPRAREAAATTGTSGDWGGGLTLPTLIRVTGRLLFSAVTCEVSAATQQRSRQTGWNMGICIHAVCVSWFRSRVPPVHLESFLLFLGQALGSCKPPPDHPGCYRCCFNKAELN